jgi:uncharacterized protein YuzE
VVDLEEWEIVAEVDREANAAYLTLHDLPVERTLFVSGIGVSVDLAKDGTIVGFEILDAARHFRDED